MKYKFEDGTEKDLSFKEMKDIESLFRIDCIYEWIMSLEMHRKGSTEDIKEKERYEMAEKIWEIVDDDEYLSQQICDVEVEALNKVCEELKIQSD